jgi:hypothetical protein
MAQLAAEFQVDAGLERSTSADAVAGGPGSFPGVDSDRPDGSFRPDG